MQVRLAIRADAAAIVTSRGLLRSLGFRELGIYEKHGKLDGVWRDVVIVERLLASNLS